MPARPKSRRVTKRAYPQPTPAVTASTAIPNEVWSQILAYLSKSDLKVVRLAGDRHLQTLASSQLFMTAYIAARTGVLNVFKEMTTHPTIRHFIKEVVYDSSWFDPPSGAIQMPNGGYRFTKACPKSRCGKLFQEQEKIQKEELSQCLRTAFANMTHVRKVVFADLSRTAGLPGDSMYFEVEDPSQSEFWNLQPLSELWTASVNDPLINRVSSGTRTTKTGRCCLRGANPRRCGSHRGVFRRQYGGLLELLEILSASAPPNFDELSVGDGQFSADSIGVLITEELFGSSYGGIPNWLFAPMSGCYLKPHYPIFKRLRKLHLTICFPSHPRSRNSNDCTAPGFPSTSILSEILHTIDDLEDLKLCGQCDTASLTFSETLGSKTWSRLRMLDLRWFKAAFIELKDMFLRHQGSLQRVNFDHFDLLDGTWLELDQFISVEIPKLPIITGNVWQNGNDFEYRDDEEDRPWYPRKKEDLLEVDFDELRLQDHDDDNDEDDQWGSSSDEELEYSEGSAVCDEEEWQFM